MSQISQKMPLDAYESLFESLPGMFLILRTDFTIQMASQAYLELARTKLESIVDKQVSEIFAPKSVVTGLRASLVKVLQNKIPDKIPIQKYEILDEEHGEKIPDERYWSILNTPVLNKKEEVRYIIMRIDDVTQERMKDVTDPNLRLLWGEERYRALTEVSPQILWEVSVDGNTTYFNQWWYDYTGLSMEKSLGSGWLEAIDPAHREKIRATWQADFKKARFIELEIPFRRHFDGQYRWHIARALPVRNEAGDVLKWVGVASDIHDHKEIHDVLLASREQLELALAAGHMGTWDYYPILNKLVWDERCKALFGLPPDAEVNYERYLSLCHPEDRKKLEEASQTALTRFGEYLSVDYRIIDPVTKQVRWVLTQGRAFFNEEGKAFRFVGTLMDVTERKLIQEKLELAIQSRDEFVSVASHELKTPLTSLQLQAQLMIRRIEKENKVDVKTVKTVMDRTSQSVKRLSTLVDDMLDVSRMNTGKLTLRLEHFDLCELVREVVEKMLPIAHSHGTKISMQVPAKLMGDWDRFRIEQVIINLITNAARHGQGTPISVKLLQKGQTAVIMVKDSGPGIAEENHERIFRRFERASAQAAEGMGLGLYIAREIVERHKGKINLVSALGQGATFIIELPVG